MFKHIHTYNHIHKLEIHVYIHITPLFFAAAVAAIIQKNPKNSIKLHESFLINEKNPQAQQVLAWLAMIRVLSRSLDSDALH